jgi:hypothetical protein
MVGPEQETSRPSRTLLLTGFARRMTLMWSLEDFYNVASIAVGMRCSEIFTGGLFQQNLIRAHSRFGPPALHGIEGPVRYRG